MVAIFCFYIEFISKDAIAFLHFTNVISILSAAVIFLIGVDSPIRCLQQGKVQEAKKSLEFISRVNSMFSKVKPLDFEKINIVSTLLPINVTVVEERGAMSLLKEICKKHSLTVVLITLAKVYIDFEWFLNTYSIQGDQSSEDSVFFNGMILGMVSLTAFLTCGFAIRWLDFFNLQLCQAVLVLMIAVYKVTSLKFESLYVEKIWTMSSYVITFSLDQTFNCYLQSNFCLMPSHLQFMAIECQLAISFCLLQLVPYVIMMKD